MKELDQAYPALINFTNRHLRRFAHDEFRREGLELTVDQWGVLKLLREHGGALSMGTLSDRMLKDGATLTGVVTILVRRGQVERAEDPDDRRKVLVKLTDEGLSMVERASGVVQRLREEVARGLSKRDVDDLTRVLGKINANIEAARAVSAEPALQR